MISLVIHNEDNENWVHVDKFIYKCNESMKMFDMLMLQLLSYRHTHSKKYPGIIIGEDDNQCVLEWNLEYLGYFKWGYYYTHISIPFLYSLLLRFLPSTFRYVALNIHYLLLHFRQVHWWNLLGFWLENFLNLRYATPILYIDHLL